MLICHVCSHQTHSSHSLSAHVYKNHGITKKQYYDTYLKCEGEGICPECSSNTTFRGSGYLKYCSIKCRSSSLEIRSKTSARLSGRKQTQETIDKRIKNTDQKKKQQTRENTLLERYGSSTYNNSEKIKHTLNTGNFVRPQRTEEWSNKIIESKKRNGTLNHKVETKAKIQRSITALYSSEDPPNTTDIKKVVNYTGRNHLSGNYKGLYYRSSYELKFLQYCDNNNISIESASTKEFRIKYFDEKGKRRFYYPDFYLPEYDIVVEIKPMSMLDNDRILIKTIEGLKAYNFLLITEEELEDLDYTFAHL